MFEIEERGLVFDAAGQSGTARTACFTSLCRLRCGTLLCSFQLGSGKHAVDSRIGICRSRDDGRTWVWEEHAWQTTLDGLPGSLAAGELIEVASGRLLLFATWFDRSDPERPLFDAQTQGILHSRQLLAESADDGRTWSGWRELDTHGLRGCAMTGSPLDLGDGRIAFAFESFREFDDPQPSHHAAWVLVSSDEGRSFEAPVCVARHPTNTVYYWDQRLCAGKRPGEFTALFWTHDLAQQRDLAVHQLQGRIENSDRVMSAVGITDTGIRGQIAAPLWLPDGRLLAFVVDRAGPCTLSLWCSRNDGRDWPIAERFEVYGHDEQARLTQGQSSIDFSGYWEDMVRWSFGHPTICQLDSERLLMAWYAGVPGCLSIHWARVRVAVEEC
jgi:hypothetical protein